MLLRLLRIVTLLFALGSFGSSAERIGGYKMLANPEKYTGHLVEVSGLVRADFEHFDLRFRCDGYLRLGTSQDIEHERKYGFQTRQDRMYDQFLQVVNTDGKPSAPIAWSVSQDHA